MIYREIQDEILVSPKLGKNVSKDLQTIEEFPERVKSFGLNEIRMGAQIKNLMEEINLNLDTAFNRLRIVEEKMQENHDLFFNKK